MGCPDPVREARLYKWGPFIIGLEILEPNLTCVGHGPARAVYVLFFTFIHSFLCNFLLKYGWMDIKM